MKRGSGNTKSFLFSCFSAYSLLRFIASSSIPALSSLDQPEEIPAEHHIFLGLRQAFGVYLVQRLLYPLLALLRAERIIRCHNDLFGSKELVTAFEGMNGSTQHGVPVKSSEVVERIPGKRDEARARVEIPGFVKSLDSPGIVRNHCTHVVRDDPEVRVLFHDARKNKLCKRNACLIKPAEDLVQCELL